MTERMQPVCKGVNTKGELVWGFVPMARWQCLMFPIRYVGDFLAYWLKYQAAQMGYDLDSHNAEFNSDARQYEGKYRAKRRGHKGD